MDNYEKKTGVEESVTSVEIQEQENFLKQTMQNTQLGRELYAFLYTKGLHFLL